MNSENYNYLTLDTLCTIFFDKSVECFKNGTYVGNPLGLWLCDCINTGIFVDTLEEGPKARLIKNITRAKQDRSAEAASFLKDINMMLAISGQNTGSTLYQISNKSMEAFLDQFDRISNVASKRLAILYLRDFCDLCDECFFVSSDVRIRIAKIALEIGCANTTDYSSLMGQFSNLVDQKDFIKILVETGRAELSELAKNYTTENKHKAIKICDTVYKSIADLTLPLTVIRAVYDEFYLTRKEWLSGKTVIPEHADKRALTDTMVSNFISGYKTPEILLNMQNVVKRESRSRQMPVVEAESVVEAEPVVKAEPVVEADKPIDVKTVDTAVSENVSRKRTKSAKPSLQDKKQTTQNSNDENLSTVGIYSGKVSVIDKLFGRRR